MNLGSTVTSWPVSSHTFHVQVTILTLDLPSRFNLPLTWHDVLAVTWHSGPLDFLSFHGYVLGREAIQFNYRAIEDHGGLASSKYIELTFPSASDGDWWEGLHAEFDHGKIFLFNPEDRDATRRKLRLCASSEGNGKRTDPLPYTPLHACDMKLRDKVSDVVTTMPAVELPLSTSRESSPAEGSPLTLTPHQTNSTTRRTLYQHRRSNSTRYSFDRIFKMDASTSDPSRKLTFTPTALSTIEEALEGLRSDMTPANQVATIVKPKHDMSATPLEQALRGWQGLIGEMQKALATLPRARKSNYEDLKARALRGVAADMSLISTTMWRLRENVETKMAELAKQAPEDDKEVDNAAQELPSGGEAMPQAGTRQELQRAQETVFEMDAQGKQENPHQSVQAQPIVTNTDPAQVRHHRYKNPSAEEERKAALRALFNVPPHVYREYLLSKGKQ